MSTYIKSLLYLSLYAWCQVYVKGFVDVHFFVVLFQLTMPQIPTHTFSGPGHNEKKC